MLDAEINASRSKKLKAAAKKRAEKSFLGQKFGKLTVERVLGPNRWRALQARCRCDCGNIMKATLRNLKAGISSSCNQGPCDKALRDLTGQKFGFLTAIKYDRSSRQGGTRWFFLCDCGQQVSRTTQAIIAGKQKSCGCMVGSLVKSYLRAKFDQKETLINRAYGVHLVTAKKRGYRSDLSREDWKDIASKPCRYCGETSIRSNKMTGFAMPCNSVDRLNNEPFYTKENSVPSCFLCQRIKMHLPENLFIEHVEKIYLRNQEKTDE